MEKVKLIVQNGQYEEVGEIVEVEVKSDSNLRRKIRELAEENAVYGDNFEGWLKASIGIYGGEDPIPCNILDSEYYVFDPICLHTKRAGICGCTGTLLKNINIDMAKKINNKESR